MVRLYLSLLVVIASNLCFGQDFRGEFSISPSVKTLRSEYKIDLTNVDTRAKATGVEFKMMFNLTRRLLIGGSYTVAGGSNGTITASDYNNGESQIASITSKQQYYGFEFQWSSDRYKKGIFYTHFDASWASRKDRFDKTAAASQYPFGSSFEGSGVGGGLGVAFLLRLGHSVSWKVCDLNVRWYSDGLSYGNDITSTELTAQTGLVIGLFRKQ